MAVFRVTYEYTDSITIDVSRPDVVEALEHANKEVKKIDGGPFSFLKIEKWVPND